MEVYNIRVGEESYASRVILHKNGTMSSRQTILLLCSLWVFPAFGQPTKKFASFQKGAHLTNMFKIGGVQKRGVNRELTVEGWFRICENNTTTQTIIRLNHHLIIEIEDEMVIMSGVYLPKPYPQKPFHLFDGKWHHFALVMRDIGSSPSFEEFEWNFAIDGEYIGENKIWKNGYVITHINASTAFVQIGELSAYTIPLQASKNEFQLDELRVSRVVRYDLNSSGFKVPANNFWNDKYTAYLFHFDDEEHPFHYEADYDLKFWESVDDLKPDSVYGDILIRTEEQGILQKNKLTSSICSGDSVLVKGIGGNKYTWEPAEWFRQSTRSETWMRPKQSGYIYLRTEDESSCQVTLDSVLITVTPASLSLPIATDTICRGDSVVFGQSKPSGVGNFYWSSNQGFVAKPLQWNQTFSPEKTTEYYLNLVTLTCTQVIPYTVLVGNRNELTVSSSLRYCHDDTLHLKIEKGKNIKWESNHKMKFLGGDSAVLVVKKPVQVITNYINRFGCSIADTFRRNPRDAVSALTNDSIVCQSSHAKLFSSRPVNGLQFWFSKTQSNLQYGSSINLKVDKSQWFYLSSVFDGCKEIDSVYVDAKKPSEFFFDVDTNVALICAQNDTAKFKFRANTPITWLDIKTDYHVQGDSLLLCYGDYVQPQKIRGYAQTIGCSIIRKDLEIKIKTRLEANAQLRVSPSKYCKGDEITLYTTADSVEWVIAPSALSKRDSNAIRYWVDTSHLVRFNQYEPNGCIYHKTAWVTPLDNSSVIFEKVPPICLGDSLELKVKTYPGVQIPNKPVWIPSNLVKKYNDKYYAFPSSDTLIRLARALKATNKTCYDTFNVKLTVSDDLKIAGLKRDTAVAMGSILKLAGEPVVKNGIGPYSYEWTRLPKFPPDRSNGPYLSTLSNPEIEIHGPLQVAVMVEDVAGCQDVDTIKVTIKNPCNASLEFSKPVKPVFFRNESINLSGSGTPDFAMNANNLVFSRLNTSLSVNQGGNFSSLYNLPEITGFTYANHGEAFVSTETALYKISDNIDTVLLAGNYVQSGTADGMSINSRFSDIRDIAATSDGVLFILEKDRIRKVDTSGLVTTLALLTVEVTFLDVNEKGEVFLFNRSANRTPSFYKLRPNGTLQTIFEQKTYSDFPVDGNAQNARIAYVNNFRVVSDSLIWFFDKGQALLRQINSNTGEISTILDVDRNIGLIDHLGSTKYGAIGGSAIGKSADGNFLIRVYNNVYDVRWLPVLCRGEKLEMSVAKKSATTQYTWSNGTSDSTLSVAPLKSTPYSVFIKQPGCEVQLNTIAYIDHADAGLNNTICLGDTLLLGAEHNPGQHRWMPRTINRGLNYKPNPKVTDTSIITMALWQRTSHCGVTVDSIKLRLHHPKGDIITDNVTVCRGDSATLVAIGAQNYSWFGNQVYQSGIDSSISYVPIRNELVHLEMDDGVCKTTDSAIVKVVKKVPIQIRLIDTSVFCPYDTVRLESSVSKVRWSGHPNIFDTTLNKAKVAVKLPTIIMVSRNRGCYMPASISLIPDTQKVGITNYIDTSRLCKGDTLPVKATSGFTQYIWNTGRVGVSTTVLDSGNVFVNAISDKGCTSTSDTTFVQILKTPDTTLTYRIDTLFASTGKFYSWYKNGIKLSDTTPYLVPTSTGVYSVEVTNQHGCSSTSGLIRVNISAERTAPGILNIYPNPTKNNFGIHVSGFAQKIQIQITNLSGVAMASFKLNPTNESLTLEVDCTDWSSGIYLVSIRHPNTPPQFVKVLVE